MNTRSFAVAVATILLAWPLRAEDKQKSAVQPGPTPVAQPAATLASPAAHNPDEVVARVNSKEIKLKELDVATHWFMQQLAQRGQPVPAERLAQFEHDMLDRLIERELVLQEGRAMKIADLDSKVQKEMQRIKSQRGDEAFAQALKDSGMSEQELTGQVRDGIMMRETFDSVVKGKDNVSAEEIKSFYDQNREKFVQPEQVKASHILIRVPSEATEQVKTEKRTKMELIRARLKQGEKFADVAKEVSEDPGSAASGGDLGYFGRGAMVPQFDVAAFSLKTNELSDIITTPFGYHVLIVTDRKPKQDLPFDQVKGDIEQHLKNRKGSEVAQQHVKDLRAAAKVEVLLPEPVAPPAKRPVTVETPPVAAPKP